MSAKTKILIVEDDAPLAAKMVHLLSHAGCDVLVADTEKKGIQLEQQEKFDLIALDVDTSGFGICNELKQRHHSRHTPIVFIARRFCAEDRRRGLELGAVDYIAEPFDELEFVPRVFSHISRKASTVYTDNAEPVES